MKSGQIVKQGGDFFIVINEFTIKRVPWLDWKVWEHWGWKHWKYWLFQLPHHYEILDYETTGHGLDYVGHGWNMILFGFKFTSEWKGRMLQKINLKYELHN